MRKVWQGFLIALALAACAQAEEWSKTYNISGQPTLHVDASDANIRVDTWDQKTIEAKVTTNGYKIGNTGVRISERQNGDSVEIEIHERGVNFCIGVCRKTIDVAIHMPREGRVKLRTGDGKIELSNLKGEMDLESGDGAQNLNAVDGTLRAHAGDGKIVAEGRFDGMQVHTGDGSIEARVRSGSQLQSSWDLRAGDGSVTLMVPENFAADIDLQTGDGHVTVDVPVQVEGRLDKKSIHGKLNGGGNLLSVHTGDGSIHLQKL